MCLTNVKHKTVGRLKLEDLLSYLLCWNFSTCIAYIHWKDWCWSWNSNTLATSCEELTHLKRPWCWERKVGREGDDRGRDGWMASLTWWTWIWVSSRNWWWTGGLEYSNPWGRKELDITERLNWLTDWNLALEPALWWMTTEHDYYRLRCKWRIMVSVMAGVYWSLTHQVFFGTCYLLWPVQFSQQVSEKGVLLPVRHGRVNNLTNALQLLSRGGRTWT